MEEEDTTTRKVKTKRNDMPITRSEETMRIHLMQVDLSESYLLGIYGLGYSFNGNLLKDIERYNNLGGIS